MFLRVGAFLSQITLFQVTNTKKNEILNSWRKKKTKNFRINKEVIAIKKYLASTYLRPGLILKDA